MCTSNPKITATSAASSDCPQCGFNDTIARTSRYKGTLKLFFAAHTSGRWWVGANKVLEERPAEAPMYEAEVLRYIRKNTTIPVPNVVADWVDGEGRFFLLLERVPGKFLEEIWSSLAQDQKERVAEQVARYIDQIRAFKSDKLQSLSGGPVYCSMIFASHEPQGPTADLAKVSDCVMPAVRENLHSQDALARFRSQIPEHGPFTFTNTDPGIWNMMVDDDLNITGILGWGSCGYFPVWSQYVAAAPGFGEDDAEWKALLRERMSEKYEAARKFWKEYNFPHL